MEALHQPTIRVIAVIAEGVPEADTKQLIAYAAQHNKVVLGPATVGGLQVAPTVPLPNLHMLYRCHVTAVRSRNCLQMSSSAKLIHKSSKGLPSCAES